MSKLVSVVFIIVAIGLSVRAMSIYLRPSSRAFREYVALAEAGHGWISERDSCRIGTKIAKALLAEKDIRYGWWAESSRRACVQAAKVDAEALR